MGLKRSWLTKRPKQYHPRFRDWRVCTGCQSLPFSICWGWNPELPNHSKNRTFIAYCWTKRTRLIAFKSVFQCRGYCIFQVTWWQRAQPVCSLPAQVRFEDTNQSYSQSLCCCKGLVAQAWQFITQIFEPTTGSSQQRSLYQKMGMPCWNTALLPDNRYWACDLFRCFYWVKPFVLDDVRHHSSRKS